jgi:hypothetical protein
MEQKFHCSPEDQRKGRGRRDHLSEKGSLVKVSCGKRSEIGETLDIYVFDYKRVDSLAERGGFEPPIELLTL